MASLLVLTLEIVCEVAKIIGSRSTGTLQHFADSVYSDLPRLLIFHSLQLNRDDVL